MKRFCKKISQGGGEDDVDMVDAPLPLMGPTQPKTGKKPNPIPHTPNYPIITIYVGQHKERILVPAQFLAKRSGWFGRALESNCTIFSFYREDPCDIRLFLEYIEKDSYTIPKDDYYPRYDSHDKRVGDKYIKLADRFSVCRFDVHNRHANLYMLGERFEVPQLRKYALTALWNLLAEEDPVVISKQDSSDLFFEERLRLIRRVYRTPRSYTTELRKLLAFKTAENWGLYMSFMEANRRYKGWLTFDDFINGAPTFIYDVMVYLKDSGNTLAMVGMQAFLDSLQPKGAPRR